MYCPEKLKLNKFKQVQIPSNKDYFGRLGTSPVPSSQYTGEDNLAPFPQRKTDELASTERDIIAELRVLESNHATND